MKALRENAYVALLARLLLGFLFVVASIDKIADPNAFAVSIGYYRLLPPSIGLVVATVLPWMELLAGLGLLFGVGIRGSSLLIFSMLAVFTAAITAGILRGLDISCGCFSRDPEVGKIGWVKLLENLGMMLLSLLLLFSRAHRFTVQQSASQQRSTP